MKLAQVKPLNEDVSIIDLHNKKDVDALANSLHHKHFPESFKVTVFSSKGNLHLGFDLSEKKINDHKSYHILTFIYELDSASNKKIHNMLKKAEEDVSDVDGEKYDQLSEELSIRTIEVHAEFGKEITKIYGHAE